jgi:hypothetical protein
MIGVFVGTESVSVEFGPFVGKPPWIKVIILHGWTLRISPSEYGVSFSSRTVWLYFGQEVKYWSF